MAGYTAQLAVAIRLATAERVICGHSNIRLMNRYSGSITRMSYSHGTCIRLILTGFCSNVDRLFALYQVQNPNAYLQPSNVGSAGNVFVEDNTVVDGDTPLLPFRRSPGSFWTTNEAMDWRIFGYDYPETQSTSTAAAQATVVRLFSGSVRERVAAGQTGAVGTPFTPGIQDATYTDWVVNTAAAPLDLPPTFVMQFSLVGDFTSDPVTDVGMWSVLMPAEHNKAKRSLREAKKKLKRFSAAEMTIHGTISLTSKLLDQIDTGTLQSLDEQDVVPFLTEKLTWKVYSVSRRRFGMVITVFANLDRVMVLSFPTRAWEPSVSMLQARSHVSRVILTRQLNTVVLSPRTRR